MSPVPPRGVRVWRSLLYLKRSRALLHGEPFRQATTRASPRRAAAPERRSKKTSRPCRPSASRRRIRARLSWGPAMRLALVFPLQVSTMSTAVESKRRSVTPETWIRTDLTVSAEPSPSRSALLRWVPSQAPAGAASMSKSAAVRARRRRAGDCSDHNPLGLMRYRFLFEQMVRRELRQKYKGSALGVLWYLVNPLVLMAAYALVFSVLWKVVDIPDYPLFLIVGLIVWVFFAQALLAAAPSLVENAPLVRKVRFPREAIPASTAVVQLATFAVMLILLVPVELIVRDSLDVSLLLLPVVVALLFCLVLGLSMAVSVLHAHYRDVEPVLAAALLPWFFITPIFLRV